MIGFKVENSVCSSAKTEFSPHVHHIHQLPRMEVWDLGGTLVSYVYETMGCVDNTKWQG